MHPTYPQPATTIYALASASGKAGVAVFRISGTAALVALNHLGVAAPTPRVATLVTLRHAGATLDQALVLYFPAPHSFTGEDVVELHTHGSRAVIRLVMEALAECPGLRLAEAGEFARRAFLSGKMDLVQAEGLADLIDAETRAQHAQSIRQLGGDTSAVIEALRAEILEPLALLEAYIDFPDEEIPESVLMQTAERVAQLRARLAAMLAEKPVGEKIRDGLEIVILGAPNAGKSSFLNYLAKREAAIVSAEAGTTRDLIEVSMEITGYAVTLVDTAGLREAESSIEQEGIRRAQARAAQADVILHLQEAVLSPELSSELSRESAAPVIRVVTKIDLAPSPFMNEQAVWPVSVITGEGMEALLAYLMAVLAELMEVRVPPVITRARHRAAVVEALAHLARFHTALPLELMGEELRLTARALGRITGKIDVEDVLDVIFSRFCIGK